jgi:hypothetical protein
VMRLLGLPRIPDPMMGRSLRDAVELPAIPGRISRPRSHGPTPFRLARHGPHATISSGSARQRSGACSAVRA